MLAAAYTDLLLRGEEVDFSEDSMEELVSSWDVSLHDLWSGAWLLGRGTLTSHSHDSSRTCFRLVIVGGGGAWFGMG